MPLKGARYTGVHHVQYQNASEDMHIVSVDHPAGEWDAIYCKTKAQAEGIVTAVRSALPATPQYVCENCDTPKDRHNPECQQPDWRCVNPSALPAEGGELPERPELRMPASTNDWRLPYDGKGMYFATDADMVFDALEAEVRRLREELKAMEQFRVAYYTEKDSLKIAKKELAMAEKRESTAIADTRAECLRAVQEIKNPYRTPTNVAKWHGWNVCWNVISQAIRSTGGGK